MKPTSHQPSLLADTLPPQQQDPDRSTVFDGLAFAQAPLTANQLADLLASSGSRTARGSGYHNTEVRRLLDELAQQGQSTRDDRGRWTAERDAGWQRFEPLNDDDE